MEREEARLLAGQQAEHRPWIVRKASRFRPVVELFLNVFPLIREVEDAWRRQVFTGQEAFNPRTEGAVRNLYAVWLGYSSIFQEAAEYLSRHGEDFEADLDRLGRRRREADRLLRGWESPVLSQGPSFRTPPLSEEASGRLREMLRDSTLQQRAIAQEQFSAPLS